MMVIPVYPRRLHAGALPPSLFFFFGESLFDLFLLFLSFAPNCPLLLLDAMRLRVGAAAAAFATWN